MGVGLLGLSRQSFAEDRSRASRDPVRVSDVGGVNVVVPFLGTPSFRGSITVHRGAPTGPFF